MAKITRKKSTPKRRPVKKAAPKKSPPKSSQLNKAKVGDEPSKAKDKPLGKNDDAKEAGKSKETDETGKVKETDPTKKSDPSKETGEGKETDTEDKFEESDELKNEKGEEEELSEELQGLKDALAALYDKLGGEEEEEKPEEAQNMGGCCGSKSSKASDSEGGPKDWNSILAAGIAAVKAQQLGGGRNQQHAQMGMGMGPNGQPKMGGAKGLQGAKGMKGAHGADQMKGAKGRTNPLDKLRADYEKAKSSGAELKPEIENQARQLLGLPPLEGAQDGQQQKPQHLMAAGF